MFLVVAAVMKKQTLDCILHFRHSLQYQPWAPASIHLICDQANLLNFMYSLLDSCSNLKHEHVTTE